MNDTAIEQIREQIRADLGQEPVRCRWCATFVSRRGIPSHVAVLACEAPACQEQAKAYIAQLGHRRAA